jgi:GNAT superfamily N-acetyltransferase
MEIREASEGDIPEIVALLKVSLGESLMPKSERYWRWKHLENPFGPSPVLLCREGNLLIGVRAFMRWEWTYQGQVYRALRAVDTATHPDHQGKGIFKKLTLSLVDYCMKRGDHFVFNTPNQQSKPGYLKMGWIEVSKLPIQIGIHNPLGMMKKFITSISPPANEIDSSRLKYYLEHDKINGLAEDHRRQMTRLITNVSAPYLTWRYRDVPVASYVAVGDEQGGELTGLIIGRIKETRVGRELRITDRLLAKHGNSNELMRKLKDHVKELNIDYTTVSATAHTYPKKSAPNFHNKASVGPMVTARSLSMKDLHMLKDFNQWSPSLGDLELF